MSSSIWRCVFSSLPSWPCFRGCKWLFLNFSTSPDSSLFQTLLCRRVEVQVERRTHLIPAALLLLGAPWLWGLGDAWSWLLLGFRASLMGLLTGFFEQDFAFLFWMVAWETSYGLNLWLLAAEMRLAHWGVGGIISPKTFLLASSLLGPTSFLGKHSHQPCSGRGRANPIQPPWTSRFALWESCTYPPQLLKPQPYSPQNSVPHLLWSSSSLPLHLFGRELGFPSQLALKIWCLFVLMGMMEFLGWEWSSYPTFVNSAFGDLSHGQFTIGHLLSWMLIRNWSRRSSILSSYDRHESCCLQKAKAAPISFGLKLSFFFSF